MIKIKEEPQKISQSAIAILKSQTSQYLESYCLSIIDQVLNLQEEIKNKDEEIKNLLIEIEKLTKVK